MLNVLKFSHNIGMDEIKHKHFKRFRPHFRAKVEPYDLQFINSPSLLRIVIFVSNYLSLLISLI